MDPPAPFPSSSGPIDVAVAGAGVVGLAAALALRRASSPRPSVAVFDPALAIRSETARSLRAVAVTAGSRRFLEQLGVWGGLDAHAQPMTGMALTDAPAAARPRLPVLTLEGEVGTDEPFAHMVLHDALRDALAEACAKAGVAIRATGIAGFERADGALALGTADGTVRVRLLVASDGSRSRLRERAGIGTVGRDYAQAAVVATLAHEREHDGVAIQHFMPGGPLALLPMRADDGSRRRTSLVWVEARAEAKRLATLDDAAFALALEGRIGPALGRLRLEDRPAALPLRVSLARRLAGPRLALVGDAARTIHPLAGQGLNLGLKDAAALAEAAGEALALGLDPGAPDVLAAYERVRRADSTLMAATTHGLNGLFSNDSLPLRFARDVGLSLIDRAPAAKRFLMRRAAAVTIRD